VNADFEEGGEEKPAKRRLETRKGPSDRGKVLVT